jgi:beta-lactamase superfamily II metal-dependent hydrolase
MDSPTSSPSLETKPVTKDGPADPHRYARVRMYNVGFGDAFLLFLPAPAGDKKILIDCGTIAQPEGNASLAAVVDDIVEAVTDEANGVRRPRIDVVIATHRHRDHVSGFELAIWNEVEVNEVWMPWTEHPTDDAARGVRLAQARLASELNGYLTSLSAAELGQATAGMPLLEIVRNALANEAAMHTLHHGFHHPAPTRRFLPEATADRTLKTDALPGVVVHVLGPSRDPKVIRNLNPPVGESYLRMSSAGGSGDGAPHPFDPRLSYTPEGFRELYKHLSLADDVFQQVRWLNSQMAPAAALALDQAINGTSLMLMFQIGQTYLLFPGDAQWGTWQMVMNDPESRELLQKTSFYKVGHHGSHNATPRQFVEQVLTDKFVGAMVSVRETQRWKEIPKKELLDKLRARSPNIVRSDELDGPLPEGFDDHDGRYVEARIPII